MRLSIGIGVFASFIVIVVGCAPTYRTDPPGPPESLGWTVEPQNGYWLLGKFVVRRGDAVDNGRIRVEITDIIPPERFADVGSFGAQARVRMRFVDSSTGDEICEGLFAEHSGNTIDVETCKSSAVHFRPVEESGVMSVAVLDISLREEWVAFELRGRRPIDGL